MIRPPPGSAAINDKLELFQIYKRTKFLSIKHDSYFQVYDEVLSSFRGREITFVEVGVFNGGSLFMWREYFGPSARIIGIELNPGAKKWIEHGFEIFIGDQADPEFWKRFYREVGPIDVLLDDGGHFNPHQIITFHQSVDHVNDGGVILIEDVHTSYLKSYGNPSRYSFIAFAKRLVDGINSRFPEVKVVKNDYGKKIYSVRFYESIVVFNVDSRRCFDSSPVENGGITQAAEDLSHVSSLDQPVATARRSFRETFPWIKKIPGLRSLASAGLEASQRALKKIDSWRLRRFFR